jgi:hypothetical protein
VESDAKTDHIYAYKFLCNAVSIPTVIRHGGGSSLGCYLTYVPEAVSLHNTIHGSCIYIITRHICIPPSLNQTQFRATLRTANRIR